MLETLVETGFAGRFIVVPFFIPAAPTEDYTLSLHDALPISAGSIPGERTQRRIREPARRRTRRPGDQDRKSTRLNSSHITISYAVFCLKKKTPKPASRYGA